MTRRYLPISDWKVTKSQKRLVNKVLDSGQITYGPISKKYEQAFAWLYGREYGLFVNSGLDALRLSMMAYKELEGWKDGDEVIIPALTFVATFNAVIQCNLKPVLVDVDETLNINPELIEKAITNRTRAIMPVNLLGKPAAIGMIMAVAYRNNLKVIEDSCETMGVPLAGELSDAACFSTYLAHHLVTGVGGMILTDSKEVNDFIRSMMWHGRVEPGRYVFDKPGFSSRGTDLQAALGLGGMENLYKDIRTRQINAAIYSDELGIEYDSYHSYQFFPYFSKKRDKLIKYLEDNGVETRTLMPLTNQPIVNRYTPIPKGRFKVADKINRTGLLLPCHPYLKEKDIKRIAKLVRQYG